MHSEELVMLVVHLHPAANTPREADDFHVLSTVTGEDIAAEDGTQGKAGDAAGLG
jgi:hypothetical protein